MNNIPNRQIVCDVLMERAKLDRDIIVLCSDSRGSASLAPFSDAIPEQFIEVGIAEQSLVSTAAGLAKCGKKPYVASPASFLSARSFEQIKVDVAYSNTNVKLIGISGGVSYGALGMTHHSAQDIAALSAIPGMRVYLPSDRHQTRKLFEILIDDDKPAYIRIGRNAVEDVYSEDNCPFIIDEATQIINGNNVVIIACGEMVKPSLDAAKLLHNKGILTTVLDMYCVKPLDTQTICDCVQNAELIVTVEEHSPFGGLGSIVSQYIAKNHVKRVINLSLPDEPVVTGNSKQVFDHYGLNANGIAETVSRYMELKK